MTTLTIAANKFSDFEALVEKLNKKAEKIGSVGVDIISHKYTTTKYDGKLYEVVSVEISRPSLRIGKYHVQAIHTIDCGAELTFSFNGYEPTVGEEVDYRRCDHCGVRHARKTVVLVSDGDTSMQVGKSCVKDFMGVSLSSFDWINKTIHEIYDEDSWSEGGGGVRAFDVDTVLAYSYMTCVERGYHKADSDLPTSVVVSNMLVDNIRLTTEAMDWVRNAKEMIFALEPTSTYEENIKNIVESSYVSFRRIGLVSSAYVMVERMIKKAELAANDANKPSSEHVGELKERITFDGTITLAYEKDGFYGLSVMYIIEDEKGNQFKWVSTSAKHQGYKKGETYSVTGTVSKHEKYNGTKQTTLKRCSLK